MNKTKDKNKKVLSPWWKGFLTSILGTTISIALTFGTTALVNSKKKADAQRLTAMMIIQDIDNSIETLRNIMEHEEKCYNAAQYATNHIDSIAALSEDTLNLLLHYIMPGTSVSSNREFDDSKERIFHSSQDTWSNLNDVAFVNNIESFYKDRRMIQELMKTGGDFYIWVKPTSKEEAIHVIQSDILSGSKDNFISYMEKRLKEERVKNYISNYYQRKQFFQQIVEGWSGLNEENKFLMNITEEDFNTFKENTIKKNHAVKEKDVIGVWIDSVVVDHQQENEYRKDHTFTIRAIHHVAHPIYSGKIVRTATLEGTWTIEGDSIIAIFNPSTCKLSADDSGISYAKEMRDSIRRFVDLWLVGEKQLHDLKQSITEQGVRQPRATNIDLTGKRLELTNPQRETTHYKRKE